MKLETALDHVNFALDILGPKFCADQARVLLVATALQESKVKHRFQIKGPARSYWQFEKYGGLKAVMEHHATKQDAIKFCEALDYRFDIEPLWEAFPYDTILAAGFARLLYWAHPDPLPLDDKEGWQYYLDQWRPGKPKPEPWEYHWKKSMELVYD